MNNWIAEAQQRADAATAGPWKALADGTPDGDIYFVRMGQHKPHRDVLVRDTDDGRCANGTAEDAAFIAAARTDLPYALAALAAVQDLADSHDRYATACEADVDLPHVGPHWRQEAHKARDEAKRIRHALGI